jgi:hypothetical protein
MSVDDAVKIAGAEIELVCLKCKYLFFTVLGNMYQN